MGFRSLRKTSLILNAIEKAKRRVTYYALDLDQQELERSLSSLGQFDYVQLVGLLGTYDQGIPWLRQKFIGDSNNERPATHKLFLWLGSSIGNQNRRESAMFLRRIQQTCMQPGDQFLIGFDQRKDPAKIKAAYDDREGVTREFIMNGLDHVNAIMKQPVFNRQKFDYDSRYQESLGRHVAHYRARQEMVLQWQPSNLSLPLVKIPVNKDELIHVEYSYKYSYAEIVHMLAAAELDKVEDWTDSDDQYRVVLAECRPFIFERDRKGALQTLFPPTTTDSEKEKIDCLLCMHDFALPDDEDEEDETRPQSLVNIVGSLHWPPHIPSLHQWQQLWRSWDLVTQTMLDQRTMLFERPIALRHPFIFYLGHIPCFLDLQLSRHDVDGLGLTEPAQFSEIFERGIDPDMDDPTQCHPHSEVPDNDDGWPSIDAIMAYQQRVRNRLQRVLLLWEAEGYNAAVEPKKKICRRRAERAVWMAFEHEAMHLETLLYMLLQSPHTLPPQHVARPPWKMAVSGSGAYASAVPEEQETLHQAPLIAVPAGMVSIGHDDDEGKDLTNPDEGPVEFGWDNENPRREMQVDGFKIQSRPVTNGEYLAYLITTQQQQDPSAYPKSWHTSINNENGQLEIGLRTAFGICPLKYARHWPVQVCYNEAKQYAKHYGMRIPTEHELTRFRAFMKEPQNRSVPQKTPNIGFAAWHPTAVDNKHVHTLGDVWEWSSTVWDRYPGFKPSALYPGYSADFFDGKHHTILGGSWATHPCIAERDSFRNWYQTAYPYVFCGFRCCTTCT